MLRRLLILLPILLAPLAAQPARADWRTVTQVAQGTAQTMEQSSFSIGIIAPLVAGLTNRLTVQTHPILDLLLVPNLAVRYRVVEQSSVVVAATASFKRSFAQASAGDAQQSAAPGELIGGAMATVYGSDQLALTGGVYYASHFDQQIGISVREFAQGVASSAQVHWLARPTDLLQISAYLRYGFSSGGFDAPVLTAAWTHATKRWLGGAHLVVIVSAYDKVANLPGPLNLVNSLPLLPTVDLWWRL